MVDRGRLLSGCTCKGTAGSNPVLSASLSRCALLHLVLIHPGATADRIARFPYVALSANADSLLMPV